MKILYNNYSLIKHSVDEQMGSMILNGVYSVPRPFKDHATHSFIFSKSFILVKVMVDP